MAHLTPVAKAQKLNIIRTAISAGALQADVLDAAGVSLSSFLRWSAAFDRGGLSALANGKSTGRPPLVTVTPQEAASLRRRYVRSNLREGAGSMSLAARHYALDPASDCGPDLRAAILRPRASKHSLPVEVRRAVRATDAAVAAYRDPDDARLNGVYAPGSLRMVRDDGTGLACQAPLRRLRPGERQSWDDASINFCVVVPWPWGGDACSERYGVRVGRFQLLAGIDDATDFCVGYSFIIRDRSSYRAEDVVSAISRSWRDSYTPESIVLEGGAWQAARTKEFIAASGARPIDAKGRPHSKLIENYWNRLWTVLSLETEGQIGRYRGEMQRETDLLMRCQAGSLDPRRAFPSLEQALGAIDRGIIFLNHDKVESKEYGLWIPAEAHAAGMAARAAEGKPLARLSAAVAHLAWPVREQRKVLKGMVRVRTETPLGFARPYHFAADELQEFCGALVNVYFDPFASPLRAVCTLAAPFHDHPIGTQICASVPCIDSAPELYHADAGVWQVAFGDGVAAAQRVKKASAAAVRREHRMIGIDGRKVKSWVSEIHAAEAAGDVLGIGQPAAESLATPDAIYPEKAIDFDALEADAGILRTA